MSNIKINTIFMLMMSIIAIDVGLCARSHRLERFEGQHNLKPRSWSDLRYELQNKLKINDTSKKLLDNAKFLLNKAIPAHKESINSDIIPQSSILIESHERLSKRVKNMQYSISCMSSLRSDVLQFENELSLCGEQFQKAYYEHVEHAYLRHLHDLKSAIDRAALLQKELEMCNNALKGVDHIYELQQKIQQCMNRMNIISLEVRALNNKVIAERDEACKDPSMLQALEAKVHAHNHTIYPIKDKLQAIRKNLDEIKTEVDKTKADKTEVDETKERIVTQCKSALDGLRQELEIRTNYTPGEKFRPESYPEFKDKEELVEAAKAARTTLTISEAGYCIIEYNMRYDSAQFNAAKLTAMTFNVMAATTALQDAFKAADVSAAPGNPAA